MIHRSPEYRFTAKVVTGQPQPKAIGRTHPEVWCEPSITIGGISYTKAQAIALMSKATSADMTYQMFSQLVAAMLNVDCSNSDESCVADAIQAANSFIAAHPVGSNIAAKSSDWKAIGWAYNTLSQYNEGKLCAPHIP